MNARSGPALDQTLIELRGGPTVTVRPSSAADRLAMTAYLEGMSSHSRHMRFMQPTPRISSRLVDALTGGDRTTQLVLVAVLDDEIVAEAMLVVDRGDGDSAEIAYSVSDRLHRRGLGRVLLGLLIGEARRRGVRRIHADLLGENLASIALLRTAGARVWFEDGGLVAEITLAEATFGERQAVVPLRSGAVPESGEPVLEGTALVFRDPIVGAGPG